MDTHETNHFQPKLPARITGIVFWGLVLVGLLVAVFLLENAESDLYETNKTNVRLLAYEIEESLEANPLPEVLGESNQQFIAKMNMLRNEMGFTSVIIIQHGKEHVFGDRNEDDDVFPYTVHYFNKNDAEPSSVSLLVYFPNQKKTVSSIRKDMLLTIGMSVFVFGLILQQVLQRVLSRPFLNMVNTARQFSHGSETVRFDQSRKDEFGYLGSFINDAIDAILLHKHELEGALVRVSNSERELDREKEFAEVTLQSITESVVTVSVDEKIQYINPAAAILLGIEREDALGKQYDRVINIISDPSTKKLSNPVRECFSTGEIVALPEHVSLINGSSSVIEIEASVAPMKNKSGDLMGGVIVIKDVSHTRRLTSQLSYQASHDMLTGLYNRRKFEECLADMLLNVREEERVHSLCYLDLDQFKIVNDTCGHVAGDELLQQLPLLFNKVLRAGDVVARLGGDEFGVLLENCNIRQASLIADKIRQQVKDYRFVWEDKTFEIGVSIGIVGINIDNLDMAEIMSAADVACYAAKDAGRNRVHIYEASDQVVSERRGQMHWTGRITEALSENRFRLFKQKIESLNGEDEEHFEVLIRMVDDDGEIIPPGAFIPAAERYNLMANIDRWVVSEVFEMIHRRSSDGDNISDGSLIAINLSGESLSDDGFLQFILDEKEKRNIRLVNICFEITETVAISNITKATRFINELKNYGCQFALDDFGSGLSSFAYLKNLPVNYLKIDGSFVKDIAFDEIDRAMVSSINQVGKVMQLHTIAECVENEKTLEILTEIGVDYVQGYHIGRPEPV